MITYKRPPQNVRREILTVPSGASALALHLWRPERTEGAIFYFHGLQSHAGWLWEVGPRLADNGVALFVLDRRGSGISPGDRHEIPDVETVLGDYATALAQVRETIGDQVPVTLFGHCLGGSFMAALMHHEALTVPYQAAIFCSTWLGRLHATLDTRQRQALVTGRGGDLWDADLKATDFTDDPKYQRFIDDDDLAVRVITRRSRVTLWELERLYLEPRRDLTPVPTAFVSGTSDPLVDLDRTHEVFTTMTSGQGMIVQFPTDKHYLFYTGVSDALIDWASAYTVFQGGGRDV